MNFNLNRVFNSISIVLGSMAGLGTFSAIATAASPSMLNPCPGIYYEEPHNSVRRVPVGCPPNAATRSQNEQGQELLLAPSTTQLPPMLPVGNQPAIATVTLQAGQANVQLINNTTASITYQVIGDTQQRTLAGGTDVMLQSLIAPVTMTFSRPDGGLVNVQSVASADLSMLVLRLNAATGLSDSQGTVRIQRTGQVLAY
jgi:hypothetical protein